MSRTKDRAPARWTVMVALVVTAVVVAGGVALAKPPGNTPGAQAQAATYFARVSYIGTDQAVLVASRGVAAVSAEEYAPGQGNYYVTFENPVDTCGWTVSVNPFYGGPPGGFGETLVGLDWDNTLPPEDQTPDPHVLRVTTTDSNGDPLLSPGSLADTITVVAHC